MEFAQYVHALVTLGSVSPVGKSPLSNLLLMARPEADAKMVSVRKDLIIMLVGMRSHRNFAVMFNSTWAGLNILSAPLLARDRTQKVRGFDITFS